MPDPARRPFIPAHFPRSFVVAVLSCVAGLVAGSVAAAAAWLEWPLVQTVATTAFIACWCAAAASGLVYSVRMAAGRYRDLGPSPWRDQIW